MRIIFLDIDGVLNCKETPNPHGFPYIIDPSLLANLEELLKRTGAKVVLSSSWRTDPVGVLAAKHYGIPFVDLCPDVLEASRCEEMLTWLSAHHEVTRYVVIDDESDCLDDLPLFQPSNKTGLTMDMVEGSSDISKAKQTRPYASLQSFVWVKIFTPCLSEIKVEGVRRGQRVSQDGVE